MDRAELLAAFERLLEEQPEPPEAEVGLAQLLTEMAALRTEVRGERRQARQALTSLQQAVETLTRESARHEDEIARAQRRALEPLLREVLDWRDRFAAGVEALERWRPGWFRRWLLGKELERLLAIIAGQRLTLTRLDQALAGMDVHRLETLDRPFEPHCMRVAEVVHDAGRPAGEVVAEIRSGYRWGGEILRPAEVVVNRTEQE
ncbi:molecular chaperone GrpE [Methylomarinovum caldicuralii]|uniref:Molecular chaperone GrpE n=1 Tax=Methylomarinovum caldicuralii TaxID=438856 RepID=A0AAU9C8I9_9GAMM|nr:nucleotide exchange factor GrpE [Methylomarinovum caldicuralii]BCX80749.1 molecular chaperone GrpE [Methylomarinovum caldicuralii]